jgi:hypothetical protein
MMPIISPVMILPLWREMASVGYENLYGDRSETDAKRRDKERNHMCREGSQGQRQRTERHHAQHQPAVLDEIAERHNQKQPGPIADLGHGHDEARRLRRQAKFGGDRADQRLGIIDVGDEHAAGQRKQERHPARDRG